MKCPQCNGKTNVSNSRMSKLGHVRRRRNCDKCGDRFTTYEIDMMGLMTYLEGKLDPQAFANIEEILLEDFPTRDIEDRISKGSENLENYRLQNTSDMIY